MKKFVRLIVVFALLSCGRGLVAQDLIITKNGDLFLCEIDELTPNSINYSFTFYDKDYPGSLALKYVAYHGTNFIEEDAGKAAGAYEKDLIVTRKGQILRCKFEADKISSVIEYTFRMGSSELRNIIKKADVAFLENDYRVTLSPQERSLAYFNSTPTPEMEATIQEEALFQDSLNLSRDLILKVNGEQLACSIEEITHEAIEFKFFMNNTVLTNLIDKRKVSHIIKDYKGELPEKVIVTPNLRDEFLDLIITDNGTSIRCIIDLVGTNTIEYFINKDDEIVYQILKRNNVLYYGNNFLENIKNQDELSKTNYNDIIVTKNYSTLLCNIESENSTSIEYSFQMNKMTMTNFIEKSGLIHFGKNFFKLQDESLNTTSDKPVDSQLATENADQEKPEEKVILAQTETVVKVQDLLPPEVIIISPALKNETTFETVADEVSSLKISGVVLDNNQVQKLLVNGRETTISSQGKFSANVALSNGPNPIEISASDVNNNESSFNYTIERSMPVEKELLTATVDKEAPFIKLDYPVIDKDNKNVRVDNTTKRVAVSGNVLDQSGVYEVLINGRDAVLSSNGNFNRNVLLRVGENIITVEATDIESNSAKEVFTITRADVVAQVKQPQIIGTNDEYHALIIGISEYQDALIPNLDNHPTNDASRLRDVLSDKYLFKEENLNLMLNPTRVDILKSFDRLSQSIDENDNLLIFFAGHGYYDAESNLGYWLPADAESDFTANWIYNDVLVANLKRIHSKHTLLISDACFSGSIFKTRSLNNAPVAYQKKYDLRSRKAITSGVIEAVPNESVFFRFLLEKLDSNEKQYFSASELFRNLEFPVANNSPNSPQYGTIQNVNDEGGDFIFIRK